MSLDGLITFLSLTIAAYAVLSSANKLRLKLHFRTISLISSVSLASVIYLMFFKYVAQPCPAAISEYCSALVLSESNTLLPNELAFLVILAWLFSAWLILSKKKISSSSIPTLSQLVAQLNREQRFDELIELIEPQLPFLDRVASRQTPIMVLHDLLRSLYPDSMAHEEFQRLLEKKLFVDELVEKGVPHARKIAYALSRTSLVVPSGKNSETHAKYIFRILFNEKALIKYNAIYRLEFGISLLICNTYGVQNFCKKFLVGLVSDTSSAFYSEVHNNPSIYQNNARNFPEHNKLLRFFLYDAEVARHFNIWKPIGDHALSILRRDAYPEYVDFLNGPAGWYPDQEGETDPIYTLLLFFDLMIKAALYQGIKWHMWLYYFPSFLQKILEIYDSSGSDVDQSAEFPTRASFLIYQIFDFLSDWVVEASYLPEDSVHLKFKSESAVHQNDNIPKSAALALGASMKNLMLSQNVPQAFKQHMHDVVLGRLERLDQQGVQGQLRRIMTAAIVTGGFRGADDEYGEVLMEHISHTDLTDRHFVSDYENALRSQYL